LKSPTAAYTMVADVVICLVLNTAPALLSSRSEPVVL
jgi:hypothetical protein